MEIGKIGGEKGGNGDVNEKLKVETKGDKQGKIVNRGHNVHQNNHEDAK